ncbi:MAG: hypothetical protein ABSH34_19865 [Verrucomicrobiota bacterium]|jgi:hypothetical protein
MKTIDLAKNQLSLDEALRSARGESLLLRCANGEQFVVSLADDFATEVELLRKNHAFLEFLDSCKKDETSVSLEEAEKRLR